jgi:hypothetical protein
VAIQIEGRRPARAESTHGVLLSGSLLRETERQYSDTASDQRIAEQFTHGQSVCGDSSHSDSSERMAREPGHGEAVSGWRGSHVTARQWADGEGAMSRPGNERMAREPYHGEIARDSGVHQPPILVLTSDRACSGAAKYRASVQQQSESGTV